MTGVWLIRQIICEISACLPSQRHTMEVEAPLSKEVWHQVVFVWLVDL